MIIKKMLILISFVFTLHGCLDFRSCDLDKIAGRYYCCNNENALNWLDLNKDGTFSHYYKEDTIKLSHHGTWKKDKKNGCVIEMHQWKTFNNEGLDYELYNNKYLFISYNHLDIGPDGESNTSFKKEK